MEKMGRDIDRGSRCRWNRCKERVMEVSRKIGNELMKWVEIMGGENEWIELMEGMGKK